MSNTDVSRLLGEKWRDASDEEKLPYRREEEHGRFIYNQEIAKWNIQANHPNTSSTSTKLFLRSKDSFLRFVSSATSGWNQNKRKRCEDDSDEGATARIVSGKPSNSNGAQSSLARRAKVFSATEWKRRKWERIWLVQYMGTTTEQSRFLPSNIPRQIIEYASLQYQKRDYDELVMFEPLINKMLELELDLESGK